MIVDEVTMDKLEQYEIELLEYIEGIYTEIPQVVSNHGTTIVSLVRFLADKDVSGDKELIGLLVRNAIVNAYTAGFKDGMVSRTPTA